MLVFVPGLQTINPDMLIEIGLEHCVDGATFEAGRSLTPDLDDGSFVGWSTEAGLPSFAQSVIDRYVWTSSVARGGKPADRYFVGWDADAGPPEPADLLRASYVSGPYLELGDGCRWQLPAVGNAPKAMLRAPSGDWRSEPQRRFRFLIAECERWRDRLQTCSDVSEIDPGELADFVEKCLRINYRLLPEVINARKMFTVGPHSSLIRAAILVAYPELLDGTGVRSEFSDLARAQG